MEMGVKSGEVQSKRGKAMAKVKLLRKHWCTCVGKINAQDRFTLNILALRKFTQGVQEQPELVRL